MGEPTRYTSTMSGVSAPVVEKEHTRIVEERIVPVPVTTTTTTTAPAATVGGLATPCHPITGATNTMGAVPMGNTTSAFPGTTTFEQTSGIPTTTHMYGVPLATYEKHLPGKTGSAVPIATATTGPLYSAPMSSTTVQTTTLPAAAAAPLMGNVGNSNTVVNDSFTPINPINAKTPVTGTNLVGASALGAAGIHHHDRAHHHHVHDHLAPGMQPAGPGLAGPGAGTMGTTAPAGAKKPTNINEHQIIQDVVPPGRDRIVEHHEKY